MTTPQNKHTHTHAHMLIQTNISKIAYTRRGPTTSRRRAAQEGREGFLYFTYTRFAYNAEFSILFVYDEDERSEKKHIQMICNVCMCCGAPSYAPQSKQVSDV